ncbi:MAG: hypothetical protein LBQ79_03800 [Deltaproteobacteria bacterium]|jgi:hypothetical protein|nr:hypothetical protein [Deltaproteobacteria bacterium]
MTVEIPVEMLRQWIKDLVQADIKLESQFWIYGVSDSQDLILTVIDMMEAALPADEED